MICVLCKKGQIQLNNGSRDWSQFVCEWCGIYWIEHTLTRALETQYATQTWKAAAYVQEKQTMGLAVGLVENQDKIPHSAPNGAIGIEQAIESFPKSLGERIDRVLLNLGRLTPHLGAKIKINQESQPLLMAQNAQEVGFIMNSLSELGYLGGDCRNLPCIVIVTAQGLERVADLQRGLLGPLSNQAFIAMSFDKTLDMAWTDGLKLGIEDCGFDALRVDKKEHNEMICDVIMAKIRKSKFLVADFTRHSPGVYFEAGYMLGLGRPVIYSCRTDDLKNAHFDTSQYNHIAWDTPEDLRKKLKRRIQATIAP